MLKCHGEPITNFVTCSYVGILLHVIYEAGL